MVLDFNPLLLKRKIVRTFRGQPTHPALIANEKHFDAVAQDAPLSKCNFVVVDTELTGLNPAVDEIVSIGAVRIRDLSIHIEDCFYTLIHPKEMTKDSILIHHITPDAVKDSPRLYRVLSDFIDFIGKDFIVGHHIGLDMSFINQAARKIYNGDLPNPCVDTMRLAQAYQEEMWENYYDLYRLNVSYNLAHLSKHYGLPLFESHNALQDALQTAYLFLYLVKKLKQGGVETLKDLYMAGHAMRWYY